MSDQSNPFGTSPQGQPWGQPQPPQASPQGQPWGQPQPPQASTQGHPWGPVAVPADRFFDGFEGVDPTGGGYRYLGGSSNLTLIVESTRIGGDTSDSFIAEHTVLDCDPNSIDHQGVPLRPGDKVSVARKIQDRLGIRDIKAYCLGLAPGVTSDQINKAFMTRLLGPEQPARGLIVHVRTHTHPQRGDPTKDFTHTDWRPARPETYERFAAQREALIAGRLMPGPVSPAPGIAPQGRGRAGDAG